MTGSQAQTGSQTQKVFICYRREETAAHAGRLYDAMVARFGERNVFMDVDIEPGVDFVERITKVVSSCLVLIVVMGRNWATVEDKDGSPRIADPDDFVRLEVETGLRRSDVTPIPVLVSGARMPSREDLPPEIQPITRRNALELSDARWAYDVGRLNTTLDGLLGETSAVANTVMEPDDDRREVAAQPSSPSPTSWRLILEGMLIGGATALAARWLGNEFFPTPDGDWGAIAAVLLRRGETWAIVGAALAVWLALRTNRRTELVRLGVWGLLVGALAGVVGGSIWAFPAILSDPNLDLDDLVASNWLELVSIAVTGGFLGALIGALWRPSRLGAGMVSGMIGGALSQLFVNETGLGNPPDPHLALTFGIKGLTIAGLTIAVLVALDPQHEGIEPATVKVTDP